MKKTTFYFIRHGESIHNIKGLISGHTDSKLTNTGLFKAKIFANKFKEFNFDVIISSDLLRAKETGKIIAEYSHKQLVSYRLLRERKFGQFENKPRSTLEKTDLVYSKLTNKEKYGYKFSLDMESDKDIYSRVIRFIKLAHKKFKGKTVLVITHGGLMTVLLNRIGYASYDNLIKIDNLGYVIVTYDGKNLNCLNTFGILKQDR